MEKGFNQPNQCAQIGFAEVERIPILPATGTM